jgi:hypothetical protein
MNTGGGMLECLEKTFPSETYLTRNHIRNTMMPYPCLLYKKPVNSRLRYDMAFRELINLEEPCVLYIGPAYRYPPEVAFYIYFFNKYKY